jgi:DNA-binding Lrp family transcriptional regulator
MHKLDDIDLQILKLLQEDGRMSNVEISAQVGLSAPPCLRRIRALEDAGLIRGYHGIVDGKALGFDVQVFAMVGLHSQAELICRHLKQNVSSGTTCESATC